MTRRLPRRWPAYAAIGVTTALALTLRIWQLTRPGSLTGIVEYDDGPYVGSAVLFTHGILPYRDYIFVQPPGIILLLAPVAWLAKLGWISLPAVMATGRVVTMSVSALGVLAAGLLVRHRGVAAVLIAGGFQAVYTGSLQAAHTVLLEPWLALFTLVAALVLFRGDRLATGLRRMAFGGLLLGFAGAVEAWAVLPVAAIGVLLLASPKRLAMFAGGVAAGFLVPSLPFALESPRGFWAGVITAQIGNRPGAIRVSPLYRFKLMAGMTWLNPMSGPVTVIGSLLIVAVIAGAVTFAWALSGRGPGHLEWFVLLVTAASVVMFLAPSQFLYHFMGWLGPFLGLSLGLPPARCAQAIREALPWSPRPWPQTALAALAVPVLGGFAALQIGALPALPPAPVLSPLVDRIVPAGACLLSDTGPPLIMTSRLVPASRRCVIMLDPTGADLELSHGLKPDTGAGKVRAVEVMWWRAFRNAQFVLLRSGPGGARVAWTPDLWAYFNHNFRSVVVQQFYEGHRVREFQLYRRTAPAAEMGAGRSPLPLQVTHGRPPAKVAPVRPSPSALAVLRGLAVAMEPSAVFMTAGLLFTGWVLWERRRRQSPSYAPLWAWGFFFLVMTWAVTLGVAEIILRRPLIATNRGRHAKLRTMRA